MLDIAQKVDWHEVEAETARMLSRLIGFDTSNPPGHTADAARYIYQILLDAGLYASMVPADEAKINVVAQVDGSGRFDPLLLLCPLDVAGADPAGWSGFHPFSGYDDGTRIWGRGALAAKSLLAAQLMALLLLARLDVPLKRHIRLAAVADGFSPNPDHGLRFLAEQHLPLIEGEKCLTWGFPFTSSTDGNQVYFLHRGETGYVRLILRIDDSGNTGCNDAGSRMVAAISVLVRNIDISIAHIASGAPGSTGARSAEAEIIINTGTGEGMESCCRDMVARLESLGSGAPYIASAIQVNASTSEPDEELIRVIEAAAGYATPDVQVAYSTCPYNLGLDSLRKLGIGVYGFCPIETTDGVDVTSSMLFGADENIARASLLKLTRMMFDICIRLAS